MVKKTDIILLHTYTDKVVVDLKSHSYIWPESQSHSWHKIKLSEWPQVITWLEVAFEKRIDIVAYRFILIRLNSCKPFFSLVTSTSGPTKDRVNQDAFSTFPDVVICGYCTFTPLVLREPVNTNLTLATTPVNLIRLRRVPTVLTWDTMQISAMELMEGETSAW